jgi:hypothetical protein
MDFTKLADFFLISHVKNRDLRFKIRNVGQIFFK